MSDIFEYGWREDHARAGDKELENAESVFRVAAQARELPAHVAMGLYAQVSAHAAIAQAHYAAANIRTRPIRDVELRYPAGTVSACSSSCGQYPGHAPDCELQE